MAANEMGEPMSAVMISARSPIGRDLRHPLVRWHQRLGRVCGGQGPRSKATGSPPRPCRCLLRCRRHPGDDLSVEGEMHAPMVRCPLGVRSPIAAIETAVVSGSPLRLPRSGPPRLRSTTARAACPPGTNAEPRRTADTGSNRPGLALRDRPRHPAPDRSRKGQVSGGPPPAAG